MNRLLILDPSYVTQTGHNHAVNSLLLSEARARGMEAMVFAHRSCAPARGIVPAFRTSAYGPLPADSLEALRHAYDMGHAFAHDLVEHVQPQLHPGDIVFAHTLLHPLLHGLAAWANSFQAPSGITFRLGLNLPPDFRQRRQDVVVWNAHEYAFAFRLLTAVVPSVRFYAETKELESQFAALGAHPICHRRLPLQIPLQEPSARQGRADAKLVYFMPGELRVEKGHQFLINAVVQIAASSPAWLERLVFRFTSIGMSESAAGFLAQHPKLFEVIPDTTISVERYAALIADADVVGCTYDPADYGMRASGIFLEAVAQGKPVLVSHHTSVAAEVAADDGAYGLAVEFGNVDSLAAGLERLVLSHDRLRRGAEAVAPRFQRELSAATFFEWLLAP